MKQVNTQRVGKIKISLLEIMIFACPVAIPQSRVSQTDVT
jgi:hypothetical protein